MKRGLLLLFMFISCISFGQTNGNPFFSSIYDIEEGLKIQNQIRDYFDLSPYVIDSVLTKKASEWALHLAETDSLYVSDADFGESVFSVKKGYIDENNKNVFTEATITWLIAKGEEEDYPYKQIISEKSTKIGVGIGANLTTYYVVAKYDSIY